MQQLSVKIPFSGFYNSSHSTMFDNWLEYEQDVLAQEHDATNEQLVELAERFYQYIDFRKVETEYAKAYCGELVKLIADASRKYVINDKGERELTQPFNLSLEFEALESPREYNFATDCIYGKIPLEQLQYMLAQIPAEDWREFVHEKCSHRSGFISYYPADYDAWEKDLSEWGEARLGMVLEAYLIHILKDESTSDIEDALSAFSLMEDYSGNGYICNWLWENAKKEFTEYADSLRKF